MNMWGRAPSPVQAWAKPGRMPALSASPMILSATNIKRL